MPRTAEPLSPELISEIRRNSASVWGNCDPTYMNMLDKLMCDVSEDTRIPEPQHGKIIILIRQLAKKLHPYSA